MQYLLDTNICIYLIKRRPESVLAKFQSLHIGSIGVSSITVYELVYGAGKSTNVQKSLDALKQFFLPLVAIPFDTQDAYESGMIRAELAKAGQIIGPYDLQIAGQARRRNLILVSNNRSEFVRVSGLLLEDWV